MSITQNTRISLTLGAAFAAVLAIVVTTWRAATAVNELRTEVADLRRDMRVANSERWTATDMERWAFLLERTNRDRNLVVPDVRSVITTRAAQ